MPEIIKAWLQSNPVRLVSYATTAAIWAVVKGTEALGIPVAPDSEVALAVGTLVGFIATEVIRKLVYSPKTAAQIVAKTTTTTAHENATAVLQGTPPAVQPAELPR